MDNTICFKNKSYHKLQLGENALKYFKIYCHHVQNVCNQKYKHIQIYHTEKGIFLHIRVIRKLRYHSPGFLRLKATSRVKMSNTSWRCGAIRIGILGNSMVIINTPLINILTSVSVLNEKHKNISMLCQNCFLSLRNFAQKIYSVVLFWSWYSQMLFVGLFVAQ